MAVMSRCQLAEPGTGQSCIDNLKRKAINMLGLLPWEKWLPPWLIGPLMVIIGIGALLWSQDLAWWQWLLLPMCAIYGGWGTWVWFTARRNIFNANNNEPPGQ